VSDRPLISCILPVFNGERFLAEAIDSVLAQSHRPLDVIVVDDGSSDGTAAIAAACGPPVRLLRQANAGTTAARNHGLATAQGEFVTFIDADDRWSPDRLARPLARFAARPELDLCFGHVQNFWDDELHEEAARFRDHRIARPIPGYSATAMLARRRLFDTLGRFDAALHHASDTEWIMRAAERDAVIELLPDVVLQRRLHDRNVSRQRAERSREEYLRLVKTSLDRRRRDTGAVAPYALPGARSDDEGE